ncbi:MAG TPA: response regulator [Gemmatimonadales bacterium]|nr:response regulator [Gemmatimonadales bacterium]
MSRKTPPSARPVDVLIASKQEWSSRSLASILAPQGYHVVKTYTRVQAIAHIRRNPPDAIIIDEELPDGDGHALCRDLYEQGLISPSTPVFLALSRSPTRRDRLAALRAGAWACLGDPLDAEELLAALDVFVLAKLDADHARSTGLVDEMTGVYNSRGLARRAEELGAHAARLHRGLGCVLIAPESEPPDGTDGGAPTEPPLALLRRIAAALRATTRHSDAIGRLNPNAFAVVAVDTDAGQARRLAERLVTAILDERNPTVTAMPRFRLKVGYHGVTDFHVAAIDSAELMLRASAALHNARTDQPDAWIQQYID